jgi:hypothetical protein
MTAPRFRIFPMPEQYTLPLLAVGGALLALGLIWLLVVAIRTGFLKKALIPVFLIVLGVAVAGFIPVYNRLYPPPVQTTAQEEKKATTDGKVEERLTLTGAVRDEYAKLKTGTKYAVVQWANADVTDDDAAVLADQTELREVDLSNSQVTDATLDRLVKLPKLTKLFAAKTKMTADGVKRLVLDNPDGKLTEIDFRGLTPPVPGAALRDWKNKDKDHRKFNN